MGAYAGGDAMRMLRAINAHQARGRVGSSMLASAAAGAAGLDLGTERYEEAVWRLLVGGPGGVDGRVPPETAAGLPFGRTPYLLGPVAARMLDDSTSVGLYRPRFSCVFAYCLDPDEDCVWLPYPWPRACFAGGYQHVKPCPDRYRVGRPPRRLPPAS